MEATGQVFGYILYESTVTFSVSGKLQPGLGAPRDRVIVYVNGQKKRSHRCHLQIAACSKHYTRRG